MALCDEVGGRRPRCSSNLSSSFSSLAASSASSHDSPQDVVRLCRCGWSVPGRGYRAGVEARRKGEASHLGMRSDDRGEEICLLCPNMTKFDITATGYPR